MRTHEATDGRAETQVEFCFDPTTGPCTIVIQQHIPTKLHFKHGEQDSVKVLRCAWIAEQDLAGVSFKQRVHNRNLDHLTIWQSVGADDPNGFWAIYGARLGTHMTMLTDWDYTQVQDFDELENCGLCIKITDQMNALSTATFYEDN
jgi:hypothetical protein